MPTITVQGVEIDLDKIGLSDLASGDARLMIVGTTIDPWGASKQERIAIDKDLAKHVAGIKQAFSAFLQKSVVAADAAKAIEYRTRNGDLPAGLSQDAIDTIAAYDAAQPQEP